MALGRKTGGRVKGSVNKATAALRAYARTYDRQAIQALAAIMKTSDLDLARVAAAKELLDRGHGKPPQALTVDADDSLKAPRSVIYQLVVTPEAKP